MNKYRFFFDRNNLNTNYQHAFRSGHSTCTALTQMTDDRQRELNGGKSMEAVLLDFSEAFDVIDHSLLVDNLKHYGFTFTSSQLIESYLTEGRQCVLMVVCQKFAMTIVKFLKGVVWGLSHFLYSYMIFF